MSVWRDTIRSHTADLGTGIDGLRQWYQLLDVTFYIMALPKRCAAFPWNDWNDVR